MAAGAQTIKSGIYHVISGEAKKWTVVPDGSIYGVKSFSSQQQAVKFAKLSAAKKTGEVIVHEKNGAIKHSISFAKK